jgi:hypothetical protein
MTSPALRKKRAIYLKNKEAQEAEKTLTVKNPELQVAVVTPSVVESEPKPKKSVTKNALVETKKAEESKVVETAKSQDQVVEQPKKEVKASNGE